MSLLLLINKPTDFDVVDAQEQYQIKSICLTAIVELLLSCRMFTTMGRRDAGQFHHIPRLPRPKAGSIGYSHCTSQRSVKEYAITRFRFLLQPQKIVQIAIVFRVWPMHILHAKFRTKFIRFQWTKEQHLRQYHWI